MPVPHVLAFTPRAADIPPDVDLSVILADVKGDHLHVADYASQYEGQLAATIRQARDRGIDLTIVTVPLNPAREAELRDLATEVGRQEHGTVLVLGPDTAGTFSDTINRARLERAEDPAKGKKGDVGHAADIFVTRMTTPSTIDWTMVTVLILAATIAAVVGLFAVKTRRAKVRV